MKIKRHFLRKVLILLLTSNMLLAKATLHEFWFTGYHYNAKALFSLPASNFNVKPLTLEQSVDLANLMYLRQSYDSMNQVIQSAIKSSKAENDFNTVYQLYNFIVERNHFAGRYLYSEKKLKTYLKEVPSTHSIYPFLKLNRIKLLSKSFQLQGGLLPQYEIDSLKYKFRRLGAYKALIETLVFDYSKNEMLVNIDDYIQEMKKLPTPFNQIGLMNLYYQARGQLRDVAILNIVSDIPPNYYLDYFRFHIARAIEFINFKDSAAASRSLTLAYQSIAYLGDIEVKRHYTGVYKDFVVWFEALPNAPKPLIKLEDYDYQGRLLASNEIAKDLLLEARQALQDEQIMNIYFKIIFIVIAVVLSIVLAFYLRAHNLLKRANIQRQWFITALSHDLRSPLAQIARSIDKGTEASDAKKLLVQLEYLLNDTLEMAIDTQAKQRDHFQDFELLELIENTLLDLDFVFKHLQIKYDNQIQTEYILRGNKNGIKIVLRNILLNAAKHNVANGYIKLSIRTESPLVLIVENSVKPNLSIDHKGTGTQLIQYFAEQSNLRYELFLTEQAARAEIEFRN